jgi:hypothetical protein
MSVRLNGRYDFSRVRAFLSGSRSQEKNQSGRYQNSVSPSCRSALICHCNLVAISLKT